MLEGIDPNAVDHAGGKSKKKKAKGLGSDPSHEIGASYSSTPDHFGRAKLGSSRASFRGQDLVGLEDGRRSVTSYDSTYRGIPLANVTYEFQNELLTHVSFTVKNGSDCKRFVGALEHEYGTDESADQQYTTDHPTYWWRGTSGTLRYEISGDSCSGYLTGH